MPECLNLSRQHHTQVTISTRALRNISGFIALMVLAVTTADVFLADTTAISRFNAGRIVVGMGLLFCAWFAHRQKPVTAFLLMTVAQVFAVYNTAFIAGYGLYSPALLFTLITIVFAIVLFGYPLGLLWCLPSAATWLVVVATFGMNGPSSELQGLVGGQVLPPTIIWISAQLAVGLLIAAIIRLYERQATELIAEEQKRHAETRSVLALRSELAVERERFMSHLSHELRTPLAAMRNAMTLVNHPKANDAVRCKSLKTLDESIGHLQSLLNDALDSFKLNQTEFTLRESEFCLNDFVDDLQSLYAGLANSNGIALTVEIAGESGQKLMGDSMRLRQMLSNLIVNAIKFTQVGGVSVKVSRARDKQDMWRFAVHDTGPGISVADQARLFKPFVQLQGQPETSTKGTGLGLSIVAQLATAMKGTVGMRSELGIGSEFFFEVPLRPALTVVAEPACLRASQR